MSSLSRSSLSPLRHRKTRGANGPRVPSFHSRGLARARLRRPQRELAFGHLFVFFYIFLFIRLAVVADIGTGGYAQRTEQLSGGSVAEQIVAKIMYLDPVSRHAAATLRSLIRDVGLFKTT